MNAALAGRELYADSPFDKPWLEQLYEAAGIDPNFTTRVMLASILVQKSGERIEDFT
jgi:hypothetical protein